MVEKLKQIPKNVMEFWNKYTSKQKTIIVVVVAAVFFAIVLLSYFLSKPQYTQLIACEDTTGATEVIDILNEQGIKAVLGKDEKTVMVEKKSYTEAIMQISRNDIPTTGMSFDDAFNNAMSTTETDKARKYSLAFQNDVRQKLMNFEGVKDATVYINQPIDDNTIFAEKKEASVSVMLELTEELTYENTQALATFLATLVGNESTDKITIIDQKSNLLFGGDNNSMLGGNVSSVLDYKTKLTNSIVNDVKKVLLKFGYGDAEIAPNFEFDMDKVTELYTEYTPAEGQEQGVFKKSYKYKTEGNSGTGGIPGTDSNDDMTDYEIPDGSSTNSKSDLENNEYMPNERVTNTEYEVGAIKKEGSSLAIVTTQYKVYNEEQLKKSGQLANTTFDEFITQNSERVKLTVDPEVYSLVSKATGIAEKNLQINAWEQPIFQPQIKDKANFSNYLMIILAVLIIALLIFVVFKGTAPVEVTELEPELSVEQLLATTKENQSLDDIEFSEKSETRKLIEKFVDENPDAVAQLLRNWLNDDWG